MSPLLLTGPGPQPADEQPPLLFCTFRLGGQLFGVDITDIKEVNTETCLTRIHHAPPQVLGCVNLRGQIFLVLDIRQLLGLEAAFLGPDSRLLIFKPHIGDSLAGLVDRIGDIVAVEPARIEPWRPEERNDDRIPTGELIGAIAKLENELLLILQANQFPHMIEQNLE
jgi:purine-binding chemotaxis protein CheW